MKVLDLIDKLDFRLLSGSQTDRAVSSLQCCDLLSWVMAKGKADAAWITVQAHTNIIAVANLLDFSCIIIPEGIKVEQDLIDKANEEDITILSTDLDAYSIFKGMYEMGLK